MNKIASAAAAWVWTVAAACAGPAGGPSTYDLQGTMGPYRIGGELVVDSDRTLRSGTYFYASRLTDISLTGSIDGETVTLDEPGGGRFRLHLVGNGSAAGQPLTFYTSVGLAGDWTKDGTTLPVKLEFEGGGEGPPPARRYGDVTDDTDAGFEARVRQFLRDVQAGDKAAAANWVSYPLRVNGHPTRVIGSKRELLARWNEIFGPQLTASLKTAVPHNMFVRDGQAMVGNGQVWFDRKGAVAINEP